jgi:hypothetical protein
MTRREGPFEKVQIYSTLYMQVFCDASRVIEVDKIVVLDLPE